MLSPDSKPPGSSGKKETVYSDRFVPSRTASAGLREFSLLDAAVPPVSAAHPSSEREDTSAAYSTLLRNELLGEARASAAGLSPSKPPGFGNAGAFGSENGASAAAGATRRYSHSASPPRNLFRFKTDAGSVASLHTPPESPYALSPVGTDVPFGTGAGGYHRRAAQNRALAVQGAGRAGAAG